MAVKVLILEENPVARSFLCRVVRESFSDTMCITEAASAEAARRHLAQRSSTDRFELVLADLDLPDGHGVALLAEMADYPALRLATTLYPDDEEQLCRALQCGADGYLFKQDRFELLVESLQKIVRGQPPLSPALARRLLAQLRAGTPDGLTPRETEVLSFLSKGFSDREIAGLLTLTRASVGEHVRALYRKLGGMGAPGARRLAA